MLHIPVAALVAATIPTGVTYDLNGPPEGVKVELVYVIHLAGEKEPVRRERSGDWSPEGVQAEVLAWGYDGFEARIVGKTRVKVIGKVLKDGSVQRIKKLEFESPDLRPDQFPKVILPAVKKG